MLTIDEAKAAHALAKSAKYSALDVQAAAMRVADKAVTAEIEAKNALVKATYAKVTDDE